MAKTRILQAKLVAFTLCWAYRFFAGSLRQDELDGIVEIIRTKFRDRAAVISHMGGELRAAQGHTAHAVGDILDAQDLQKSGARWVWGACSGHNPILAA